MSKPNILRGTMMLTSANFLSKILGVIYVIPFYMLVGDAGGTLFNYGYIPYMIFISISTMGIPLAMSKFVSKYHALGDYTTKEAMYRTGLTIMIGTGFFAFALMFLSADWLAGIIIPNEGFTNTQEDVAFVIQMVSFALLVIPAMSLTRGYFQGHNSMGPTAVSVVVEQIARIIFLLAATYIVIEVLNGSMTTAVGMATFSALIGAIASSIVLVWFYRKRKPLIERELENAPIEPSISKKKMVLELLSYAGPFVLVGVAIPLYQFIDTLTFNRAMAVAGLGEVSEQFLSVISLYGHKIVVIPITIATGLALASLPAVTQAFTTNDANSYHSYLQQTILNVFLFIFPAVVGIMILAEPLYGTFYSPEAAQDFAAPILAYYAPAALFFGLFTVTASILQGINRQNFTVISLLTGLVIKGSANAPMIIWLGPEGAVFATILAALAASGLNLWKIQRVTQFDQKKLFKKILLIVILSAIMGLIVLLVNYATGLVFGPEATKLKHVTQLLVSVVIGIYAYFWMAYKTTLLERLLGAKVKRFSKFFI
ncbi:putative polysaccharide biosynthesis protein [Allobacillus halotolerans]|uniref:Polysaccharide biosynthesis protein n=1 Tax=Allobacillus halotolerans TaxID=570278 RepID=A0ABS6GMD8_9BACI|nr:polysaccharide biosynthesis protein [Allobacillus halotolerans]MBU6080281.1 polysaccharide biosynthesis protein [Allobacillus halotolerans]